MSTGARSGHVLEEEASLKLLLANARHVKNLPGRKTDVVDAGWLAQLLLNAACCGAVSYPPRTSPACVT